MNILFFSSSILFKAYCFLLAQILVQAVLITLTYSSYIQGAAIEHKHHHQHQQQNNFINDNNNNSDNYTKPNIMIIFADDVGTGDVPGYWNDYSMNGIIHMPNIQHLLLDSGTTFTDAHSTPLCSPSRYVLLSGNYQHRGEKISSVWTINYSHGQFRLNNKNGGNVRNGQQSIAQVLRDSGYDTSMVGKWHLGGKIPRKKGIKLKPNDFPNPKALLSSEDHDWFNNRLKEGPWDIGFDHSYITTAGIQNPPYVFLRNGKIPNDDLTNYTFWKKGTYDMPYGRSVIQRPGEGANDWDSSAYNMILVNETEHFLHQHLKKRPNQPFLSYVALGAVHRPWSPPDKYLDGEIISGRYDSKHKDMLFEMDKVVGSLIRMLEEKKFIENTIVVFASDNGGIGHPHQNFSGGPLRQAKGSVYEGGHRIPLIMRWDKGNIPKGETRSHLVGLNDLFATLCHLAGVEIPIGQAVDSVSFADYALDEGMTQGLREYLGMWEFKDNTFTSQAIRKGEMKLIHQYHEDIFELYNLTADISETRDLSKDDPELVEQMFEKLKEIAPCYDRAGKFNVYIPWEKVNVRRDCVWFGRKPQRCKFLNEGRLNCRLSCAPKDVRLCDKSHVSKSDLNKYKEV